MSHNPYLNSAVPSAGGETDAKLIELANVCAAAGEICNHAGLATNTVPKDQRDSADAAYQAAYDNYSDLAGRLLTVPAQTLEGLIAKARAFSPMFADDLRLNAMIQSHVNQFGLEHEVCALSLASDLLRLARARLSS